MLISSSLETYKNGLEQHTFIYLSFIFLLRIYYLVTNLYLKCYVIYIGDIVPCGTHNQATFSMLMFLNYLILINICDARYNNETYGEL